VANSFYFSDMRHGEQHKMSLTETVSLQKLGIL